MARRLLSLFAVALATATPVAAQSAPKANPEAEAQALDMLKRAIAFRSVAGPGNQTPQLAAYFKQMLVAGGFGDADVTVTPLDDTAYLVARYRGSDPTAKPILIGGHMDVVEAKPSDWQRDPFTPVVENGMIYGRGATDTKFNDVTVLAALLQLKREHFVPRRDIIVTFSGDEETRMKTAQALAAQFGNGELMINTDGASGKLAEADGKPETFAVEAGEKVYADFQLQFTNPGGHSSAPRKDNAIYSLARALDKIAAYQFAPQINEISRAWFVATADRVPPQLGAAMRAFAANPNDPQALAVLRADPAYIGKVGTTCVATMINGGHALNALPARATANINCRIFPGNKPSDVLARLAQVVGDPEMTIKDVTEGSTPSDASPLRPDLVSAVKKALAIDFPGVPAIPTISSGASDSMWFRSHGVPSYGIGLLFIKDSDSFEHGLNERSPLMNIGPAIRFYRSLFTDLSK
jgi:acetylornithine deacetylase/succinyl-diaminopimelate desuccinylase-like protein